MLLAPSGSPLMQDIRPKSNPPHNASSMAEREVVPRLVASDTSVLRAFSKVVDANVGSAAMTQTY